MTDAAATVETLPPAALIAVDIWSDLDGAAARLGEALGGSLPGPLGSGRLARGWRALRVEPTVWWLVGPLADLEGRLGEIEAVLGDDGATVDLSGGVARLQASGPAWRELLMFGGVLDAEHPAFGPGASAGTVLHHAGVRYDVLDERHVHILVAPSYADDLLRHLRTAAARLGTSGA